MNVLIMRPSPKGEELVAMLQQHNIAAIHLPLFTLTAGRDLSHLPNIFSQLTAKDALFAVSKHAIDFTAQTLQQIGFPWRGDLHYFAIGQHTANHFAAQSEQTIHYPISSETSEGLLALPQLQSPAVSHKNFVILRAESGRELISQQLQQRGAKVITLECYQRTMITYDFPSEINLCKRFNIDTIVITSTDILLTFFKNTPENEKNWLFSCQLVVVSQRIALLSYQLGWQKSQVTLSPKADNMSLLTTLLTLKS